MLKAKWCKYTLHFKFLAKTSREEMTSKDTYFIKVFDSSQPDIFGLGESALFRGLSQEDTPDYEHVLSQSCKNISEELPRNSSIRFAFESALSDLKNGGRREVFKNVWQTGKSAIAINGLIWMGDKATMLHRVEEKLKNGFKILKLKIGGIDFEDELSILREIRSAFPACDLELRLDANGSFNAENAMQRLDKLSKFDIHSIEQPIAAGQTHLMRDICKNSPIDVALDEELIGWKSITEMESILDEIHPQYIILKPTLCGGFERSDTWIKLAEIRGIKWWATSALESNVGLNAIAQWVSTKNNRLVQGLGTGELYTNNIISPIQLIGPELKYNPEGNWKLPDLLWLD